MPIYYFRARFSLGSERGPYGRIIRIPITAPPTLLSSTADLITAGVYGGPMMEGPTGWGFEGYVQYVMP